MSLIKLTVNGNRTDVVAAHVVSITEQVNQPTLVTLSTGEVIHAAETGRSVRGYVKKALAASSVTDTDAE